MGGSARHVRSSIINFVLTSNVRLLIGLNILQVRIFDTAPLCVRYAQYLFKAKCIFRALIIVTKKTY